MTDSYIYIIIALLPLAALMLVFQVNPYHALVIRAILGGVAALVYAVLGAADVALTEALVGTMLAITLYVVAVRSSSVMRLGVLSNREIEKDSYGKELIDDLKKILKKYYLRLELVEYDNLSALKAALMNKEVHGICTQPPSSEESYSQLNYHTEIRVLRLWEIMKMELSSKITALSYVNVLNKEEQH